MYIFDELVRLSDPVVGPNSKFKKLIEKKILLGWSKIDLFSVFVEPMYDSTNIDSMFPSYGEKGNIEIYFLFPPEVRFHLHKTSFWHTGVNEDPKMVEFLNFAACQTGAFFLIGEKAFKVEMLKDKLFFEDW